MCQALLYIAFHLSEKEPEMLDKELEKYFFWAGVQ